MNRVRGRLVLSLFTTCMAAVWNLTGSTCLGQNRSSLIHFEDSTKKWELNFRHEDGSSGQRFLVELMGSGLATLDADNDGWLDVYFLNGAALPGSRLGFSPTDCLFRNRQGEGFSDVTANANCVDSKYGLAAAAADFDNDGFEDLYISNFGANSLMHNNGDGTFSDVTRLAAVEDGNRFGAGVLFLDIDNDGDLDLFSANYVQFDFKQHELLAPKAFPYSPGPKDFPADSDSLFENNGDGTFSDISLASGISKFAGPSMGCISGDFDFDGDWDIFVCCDGAPNLLYRNSGSGLFIEQALLFGVAYDHKGMANGSMGVDASDLDGDGRDDLIVTDYSDQLMMHFRSLGDGLFEDIARTSKIGSEVFPHVNWGVGLADLDRDGDRDTFICNGHLLTNAKDIDRRTDYKVPNCVMENNGRGSFRSVTWTSGEALTLSASSRGCVLDDLDRDGDVDIIVLNCNDQAQVLENVSGDQNSWLEFDLRGRAANRSAIGTRVTITVADKSQVAEVRSGRGYQSHFGSRLHFGWASSEKVADVEIKWPAGNRQYLKGIEANQLLTIVEEADVALKE